MSYLAADEDLARAVGRLAPFARFALERAARYARHLHADQIAPEHVLASLLEDEECGATRVVLHAFADPETIGVEVMALCPGILVVASERSLPFSVLGLSVLEETRADAAARRAANVRPALLFEHSLARAPEPIRNAVDADWRAGAAHAGDEPVAGTPVLPDGPLFKGFSKDALRALGVACRAANRRGRSGISPAHLILGCLEVDEELRRATGLTVSRASGLLQGVDADDTNHPAHALAPTVELRALLHALDEGAGTVQILSGILERGTPELRALLQRQKITPELVHGAGPAFEDPAPPA